jgi:hypothetical protein
MMLVDARLGSPDMSHAAQNGMQCLRWKRSKQKIYREIGTQHGGFGARSARHTNGGVCAPSR